MASPSATNEHKTNVPNSYIYYWDDDSAEDWDGVEIDESSEDWDDVEHKSTL